MHELASLLAASGITRRAHVLLGRIAPHTIRKHFTISYVDKSTHTLHQSKIRNLSSVGPNLTTLCHCSCTTCA
jgi:hypothetical protein